MYYFDIRRIESNTKHIQCNRCHLIKRVSIENNTGFCEKCLRAKRIERYPSIVKDKMVYAKHNR
jgi:hypothetical protein